MEPHTADSLHYQTIVNHINKNSIFACMPTSCNTKPQRGVTMVASRFRSALCDASRLKNGWYKAAIKKRAFRYATLNPCRVPTARYPSTSSLPAIEMAGRSTSGRFIPEEPLSDAYGITSETSSYVIIICLLWI